MATFDEVIAECRVGGLFLDSNLLLLLVIGAVDRELVARFKRTRQFLIEDYDLLCVVVSQFTKVVTTPHVLAEVSNLANALEGRYRDAFFAQLARVIEVLDEHNVAGRDTAREAWFSRLGVTDTAITLLAAEKMLVLTVDAALANCVAAKDGHVINFHHLRASFW